MIEYPRVGRLLPELRLLRSGGGSGSSTIRLVFIFRSPSVIESVSELTNKLWDMGYHSTLGEIGDAIKHSEGSLHLSNR